ncbi:oligosaccharide flippase family protein [Alteromonas sp. 345S023]|uniref:Oligosaccharide flippase family protein n=1 Tax=Alteromonas profundi TaxID=2696062 RepID=A0A7X5LIJ1_9ALTE|nr:lipopolysaccharide biosynthesis protein [Alteromonas profundi]NDV89964.1 oligosaccharide flippase family protein [Alteromonas profundi]
MNRSSLKKKALSSIAWSGSIQISSQVLNFVFGIVLARLLAPEVFGLMAMLLVFSIVSQLLSDFGFSASLIQKKEVTSEESFSCFVVNCLIGTIFAICLILANSSLAQFYGEPFVEVLALAIAPLFLINSTCSVPTALLSRELSHKKISVIQLSSVLLGSLFAIVCAILEFGVWSLVVQQYVTALLRAMLLLKVSNFKVSAFRLSSVKPLLRFSASVFTTKVIQQVAQQTDKVLVGKFAGAATLGFYSRAYYLTAFPITNITRVVSDVMFPVLSQFKEDISKVKEVYFRLVGMIAVLTFPILIGMAFLAEDIILLLLGERWLPMTKFFVVFSLVNIFSTIGQLCSSFFLSQGRADLLLKINLFTQPARILLLIIGIQWGIEGILLAYIFSTLVSFFTPLLILTRVVLKSNISSVFLALFKPLLASVLMYAILVLSKIWMDLNSPFMSIFFFGATGAISYLLFMRLFKDASYLELESLLLKKIKFRNC